MTDISTIAAEMRIQQANLAELTTMEPLQAYMRSWADALDAAAKEQQAADDKQYYDHEQLIAEQQAEIERLRREVEKLKADNATLDTVVGMMQDTLSLEPEEFSRVKQKTKETAEALRTALAAGEPMTPPEAVTLLKDSLYLADERETQLTMEPE